MKPPKCRSCGVEEWRHVCDVSFSDLSRVTSKVVAKVAVVKPVAVKPVKPPQAEPGRSNATTWRERDPEAYRKYMREYMARRRSARREKAVAP